MKRLTVAQYQDGLRSLDNLTEMIGEALEKAMDKRGELRRDSAYAWRGYKIVSFPGLDPNHYYCQIFLNQPNIVAFFEYYEMKPHPFQVDFDLVSSGFFLLDRAGQLQALVGFITIALDEARRWNDSDRRRQIVSERFL